MRERFARKLAIGTGVVIIVAAAGLAALQNREIENYSDSLGEGEVFDERINQGRELFENLGCTRCHSVGGRGSPRYPLDGVGDRIAQEEIAQWIIAPPEMKSQLPPGAFNNKQAYQTLTKEDIEALVVYLYSLHN